MIRLNECEPTKERKTKTNLDDRVRASLKKKKKDGITVFCPVRPE